MQVSLLECASKAEKTGSEEQKVTECTLRIGFKCPRCEKTTLTNAKFDFLHSTGRYFSYFRCKDCYLNFRIEEFEPK